MEKLWKATNNKMKLRIIHLFECHRQRRLISFVPYPPGSINVPRYSQLFTLSIWTFTYCSKYHSIVSLLLSITFQYVYLYKLLHLVFSLHFRHSVHSRPSLVSPYPSISIKCLSTYSSNVSLSISLSLPLSPPSLSPSLYLSLYIHLNHLSLHTRPSCFLSIHIHPACIPTYPSV